MKYFISVTALAMVLLPVGADAGPSAKFAATYSKNIGIESVAVIEHATEDALVFDSQLGYSLANIKVPQDKELLIGLSAEVGLTTDTSIKGKDGATAKSIAFGRGAVSLWACPAGYDVPSGSSGCRMAEPGWVILSRRFQLLDATLGGVIESCTDADLDGDIVIGEDCEATPEEIGLMLSTLSAQHFNFVLPNLDQGEYDIVALFQTLATTEILELDQATLADDESINVSASAYARAFIGKYMLTVQQVRATEGGIVELEIEPF